MGLMCPGRQLLKVWGPPFVLWCLGLQDQGCGKEGGRERESRQGHAALPQEGHGMWLATGCMHSSTGMGSTELAGHG